MKRKTLFYLENILVKDRDDLSSMKIADFGLSGQFGAEGFMKTFRQKCGTMIYMAPELALNMLYSKVFVLYLRKYLISFSL